MKKSASIEARGQNYSEDIDHVTLRWKPSRFELPINSFDAEHISQEKLVESLAHQLALTINERWHLSGCDRCARSLDVLRKLRDSRLGAGQL
jgi:hypothetical protein